MAIIEFYTRCVAGLYCIHAKRAVVLIYYGHPAPLKLYFREITSYDLASGHTMNKMANRMQCIMKKASVREV